MASNETPPGDFRDFVRASHYAPRQPIVVVTQIPRSLRKLHEEADQRIRELFERQAMGIYGIRAGLRWITANNRDPQSIATAKGSRSVKYSPHRQNPTFIFREVYGKAVSRCLDALIHHRAAHAESLEEELNLLIIEPDPTLTLVSDAWHFKGLFPLTSGDQEVVRDMSSQLPVEIIHHVEMAYRSVEHRDEVTEERAQHLLNAIHLSTENTEIP